MSREPAALFPAHRGPKRLEECPLATIIRRSNASEQPIDVRLLPRLSLRVAPKLRSVKARVDCHASPAIVEKRDPPISAVTRKVVAGARHVARIAIGSAMPRFLRRAVYARTP